MEHTVTKISEMETSELIKIAVFAIIIGAVANLLAIMIAQRIS
jgi:hypothetical protein